MARCEHYTVLTVSGTGNKMCLTCGRWWRPSFELTYDYSRYDDTQGSWSNGIKILEDGER